MAKRGMTAEKKALMDEYNALNSKLNEVYGVYEDSCWLDTVLCIPLHSNKPSKKALKDAIEKGKEMIANPNLIYASEKQIGLIRKKAFQKDDMFIELRKYQDKFHLLNKKQASQLIQYIIGLERAVHSTWITFASFEDEEKDYTKAYEYIFSHLTKNKNF